MPETYNPIIRKEKGRFILGGKNLKAGRSTVLVFLKHSKVVEMIRESEKVTWSKIIFDGYDFMYEIDLSTKHLTIKIDSLPSKDSYDKMFEATIKYDCKVIAPEIIISEEIENIEEVLRPKFKELLRKVSSSFSIEERDVAEKEAGEILETGISDFAAEKGLSVGKMFVELELNKTARDYLRKREAAREKKEEVLLDFGIKDIELKFYEKLIKGGNLLAFLLVQNNNEVEKVLKILKEEELLKIKTQLAVIASGALSEPEAAERAKKLLADDVFRNNKLLADNPPSEDVDDSSADEANQNETDPIIDNEDPLDIKNF